jgi:hypothetical protein
VNRLKLHFVAPLSYGNESLVGIRIALGLRIEKWGIQKAASVISQCSPFDEEAVRLILRECFCLDEDENNAYVVAGSYELVVSDKRPLYPLHPGRIKSEGFGGCIGKTENTIRLMRLFKEGSIDVARFYLYEKKKGAIDPVFSSEGSLISPQSKYSISEKERPELSAFLKQHTVPLSPSYVQLAFDNFDQSYNNHDINLAFLSLMIAVEVLFNDGTSELKYRITRGMSVLLGDSQAQCREIYSHVKKLYDKRSHLVHTGKAAITAEDLIMLRHYLRVSIKELLHLRLSKTELSAKLLEHGFGQRLT